MKFFTQIFEVDAKIVTGITSYLVLHKTCYDLVLKENMPERDLSHLNIPTNTFLTSIVVQIPLLFGLFPLIKCSSLIVSMYPMLIFSSTGRLIFHFLILLYLHLSFICKALLKNILFSFLIWSFGSDYVFIVVYLKNKIVGVGFGAWWWWFV